MMTWPGTRTFLVGLALVFGFACLSLGSSESRAASLAGDTINGSLNFCTLGNGGNQFQTPVSQSGSAPVAFNYTDGADVDTATFTATTLTVEDNVLDFACGWGMSFTDSSTPFPALTLISDNFSPDLTYELTVDGTINISWNGTPDSIDDAHNPGDYVAVFNIDGVIDAPEPRSLALFFVGLCGVGLVRQRRRSATTIC